MGGSAFPFRELARFVVKSGERTSSICSGSDQTAEMRRCWEKTKKAELGKQMGAVVQEEEQRQRLFEDSIVDRLREEHAPSHACNTMHIFTYILHYLRTAARSDVATFCIQPRTKKLDRGIPSTSRP